MPPDLMSFISESITELVNNYTTVCFEALTINITQKPVISNI